MLWLGFALLTLAALGFLAWPLLRTRRRVAAGRRAHDLAVYRAQLAEVEQDAARSGISAAEAAAARLEIQRRLLRADMADGPDGEAPPAPSPASGRLVRTATIAVLLLVPLAGGALYLDLGRPDAAQFDRTAARARAEHDQQLRAQTETLIARLRERLDADPTRADGWLLLARSLLTTDHAAEAVDAAGKVIALQPDNAEAYALRGEAQTLAADGSVTPAAQQDFQKVLQLDAQHPGARYYLGLARQQAGDNRGAYDDWRALAADSPADAPWLPTIAARLRELAPRLGIALADAVPPPRPAEAVQDTAPGPDQAQMQAAQQMSPEERTAMIRGMVDRLAEKLKAEPDDVDGWLRLARARDVLGDHDAAREALTQAVAHGPGRTDARMALAFNLAGPAVKSRAPLPADAIAQFRAVLEQEPTHAQALWFVGRAAYEAGDKAGAARYWKQLLAQLPLDSPEAKELGDRISSLTQ